MGVMCELRRAVLPGGAVAACRGPGRPFVGVGRGRVDDPRAGGSLTEIMGAETAILGAETEIDGASLTAMVGKGRLSLTAMVGKGRVSLKVIVGKGL